MDTRAHLAHLQGRSLMAQDKIIAVRRECEETCLRSDAPDYRALYFRLFACVEEVRRLLELKEP